MIPNPLDPTEPVGRIGLRSRAELAKKKKRRHKDRRSTYDSSDGREPFRCVEPEHDEREHGARVQWYLVGSKFDRGSANPECCGQVMEMLSSREAAALVPPKAHTAQKEEQEE